MSSSFTTRIYLSRTTILFKPYNSFFFNKITWLEKHYYLVKDTPQPKFQYLLLDFSLVVMRVRPHTHWTVYMKNYYMATLSMRWKVLNLNKNNRTLIIQLLDSFLLILCNSTCWIPHDCEIVFHNNPSIVLTPLHTKLIPHRVTKSPPL